MDRGRKILFVFLFTILWLPYLQHKFHVIDSGTLHGYFTNSDSVDLTIRGWFDGAYQPGTNNYYNDHIGFRQDLVRLNAQIDYSLFQKLDYGATTLGSDNYLYFDDYIEAYYGRDFVGSAQLAERMLKLKRVQDTLGKLGKTVIMVYAPCKAWYYPEHIPASLAYPKGAGNNYLTSKHAGDSLGVNQIDFNAWFLSMKETTKDLLFSRQGIHWTNYGAMLAGDSLVRYIERVRGISMPHPRWQKINKTTQAILPDNDMADILNLIFPITVDTLSYPEVYYLPEDSGKTRPKCIYIGDSYVINLLRTELVQHINSEWQFWFYYKHVLNDTNYLADHYLKVADQNLKNEVTKADCIILLQTPKNTNQTGYGFIEDLYAVFYPDK